MIRSFLIVTFLSLLVSSPHFLNLQALSTQANLSRPNAEWKIEEVPLQRGGIPRGENPYLILNKWVVVSKSRSIPLANATLRLTDSPAYFPSFLWAGYKIAMASVEFSLDVPLKDQDEIHAALLETFLTYLKKSYPSQAPTLFIAAIPEGERAQSRLDQVLQVSARLQASLFYFRSFRAFDVLLIDLAPEEHASSSATLISFPLESAPAWDLLMDLRAKSLGLPRFDGIQKYL